MLDPAFFMTGAAWSELASERLMKERYFVFYALETNELTNRVVERIGRILGIRVVVVAKGGKFITKIPFKLAMDAGPKEFLSLIQHAEFVISNSFHATVFALLFKVPFLTVGHSTRNARMESLLECFGLSDRLITEVNQIERVKGLTESDALKDVDDRLGPHLDVSRRYLKDSLKSIQNGLAT